MSGLNKTKKNIFAGKIASVEKIETIVKEIDGKITGETLYTLGSKVIDLYHFYHYWDAVPTYGPYINDCIDFLNNGNRRLHRLSKTK